jgi:hypothetical protein
MDNPFTNIDYQRHYYAGQALVGLLARSRRGDKGNASLAEEAFAIADAMVKVAWGKATLAKQKAALPVQPSAS